MPYVIGIDGGGTKTSCVFQQIDHHSQKPTQQRTVALLGEGTNPQAVGFDMMRIRLRDLIGKGILMYKINPKDIIGICAGIAGARLEADRTRIEQELRQIGTELKLHDEAAYAVTTDLYIALRGALHPGHSEGILVISGTGSNVIGLSEKTLFTNGGWGHLLGDEGSGYVIGLEALRAVCKAFDHREVPTLLTDMILESLKLSEERELISYMYQTQPPKNEIAGIAKLVIDASHRSDQVAIRILEKAADDLVALVRGIFVKSRRFGVHSPVFVTGSIFTYSDLVRNRFAERLQKESLGIFQTPHGDALDGALAVACETALPSIKRSSDGDTK